MRGTPESVEIVYSGEMGVTDTYPITAAILTGFLKPMVESVNIVSAPALLKDRGIEANERRTTGPSDYAFQIGLVVKTDTETHEVFGTLFGDNDPRICSIDGTRVDAVPEGCMVVCRNEDKPMVLGRLCTVIGDAGVNIANLVLGRETPGGHAHTIINIDSTIPEAVLEEIRQIPHVLEARLVHL
jgi:D-3-phosphoglycerate dehydrogenase